jgi:hypothetical protein
MNMNFDRPRACSRWRCGAIYRELKETSCWAKIWTPDNVRDRPDNVRLNQTKFDRTGRSRVGPVGLDFNWVWLGRTKSGNGRTMSSCNRQCLLGPDKVWKTPSTWVFWSKLEFARIDIFHFILHTPLNSRVCLNSRNIKTSYSTVWALFSNKWPFIWINKNLGRGGVSLFLLSFLVT